MLQGTREFIAILLASATVLEVLEKALYGL
jgi:hypothetical protein